MSVSRKTYFLTSLFHVKYFELTVFLLLGEKHLYAVFSDATVSVISKSLFFCLCSF